MGRPTNAERAARAAAEANAAASAAAPRESSPEPAPESATRRPDPAPQPTDAEVTANIEKAKRNAPHKLGMEEIRARRASQEGSLESLPRSEAKPEPVAKAEPAPTAAPEAAEPVAEQPVEPAGEQVTAAPEAPKMVKVKVDGVESEVPQADIDAAGGVHAYQRDKASENRLQKAQDTLAEARRTQAAIAAFVQQNAQPAAPKPTTDQLFAKLAQSRFGSDEEFAGALREVFTQANPPVDQHALVLKATSEINRNTAMSQFNKEFQDIVSNSDLKALVSLKEQQALAPYVQNGQPN